MCDVLYAEQTKADSDYKKAFEEWRCLPKNERNREIPPDRSRGYFVTDLTLEGLREDHSGHGGKVCILDELSSFISSQNQYKSKGSDRESWLCLHDGRTARIVRAGKSLTLSGSRVSIFGGVQPGIWRKSFSGEEGEVYLIDGTIFRFLPTYGGSGFYPLTEESWSDANRMGWENTLSNAMRWADIQTEANTTKNLILSEEARGIFLDWRNGLFQQMDDFPNPVRGFIPKIVGYCLRFAGILYLMDVFSKGEKPGSVLNPEDIKKGMRVSEFYLGHILEAMKALSSEDAELPFERTDQVIHVARTLEALQCDVDKGLLATGHIHEAFNKTCSNGLEVKTAKLMGSILRGCGLSMALGNNDANGRRRVRCLRWDEKTETFIRNMSPSLQSLQSEENHIVTNGDIEKRKSPKSPKTDGDTQSMETLETLKNVSLQSKPIEIMDNGDMETLETLVSSKNENSDEFDWSF